jgi:uncharacterized protein (DUF58 family)
VTADQPISEAGAATVPRWALSAGLTGGVLCGVLLAAAGLLFARVDLVLLAVPLIASAAWAWDKRPAASAAVTLTADVVPGSDAAREHHYVIRLGAPIGTDSVHIRLSLLEAPPRDIVITAASARTLTGVVPILHSGPQELLQLEYRLLATDAAFTSAPSEPFALNRVVQPPFSPITSLPLPGRLLGLTGLHDSSRPGDGGEFRDIHPFAAGDKLRRIDWKATARLARNPADLYVRRTAATSDATVFLVLDSRDDVGENADDWDRNTPIGKGLSSMDLAREAASSLAAGYIGAGDRVGFQDLATQGRSIATGTGSRHLQRLLRSIELAHPRGVVSFRQRPPTVQSGALVYVLSTFLDEQAGTLAAQWRGGGHRVIAVDVLPTPQLAKLNHEETVAFRIVSMERADRIRRLQGAGVELLRWHTGADSGLRYAQLRSLSRPARGIR